MKQETYKCDVCGKVKGETNHWFWGFFLNGKYTIGPWDVPHLLRGQDENIVRHFCGIGCALQEISRVMQPSNREPAVPSPSSGSQEVKTWQ